MSNTLFTVTYTEMKTINVWALDWEHAKRRFHESFPDAEIEDIALTEPRRKV